MKPLLDRKYNEREEKDALRSEVLEGFSDEIIEMIGALKTEMDSFTDLGIDLEEKSFYDILKNLAHKYDFDYPEDVITRPADKSYLERAIAKAVDELLLRAAKRLIQVDVKTHRVKGVSRLPTDRDF